MVAVIWILIVIGFILQSLFIKAELASRMVKAVVLKGLAAAFFVALGSYLTALFPSQYAKLVLIGLILGMIGDILLNLRYVVSEKKSTIVFALGILAFLSGHFLYIASLFHIGGSSILVWSLCLTVVLSLLAIPQLMKRITAPSKGLKIFGYVYLVIVTLMFCTSASLLIRGFVGDRTIVFVLGALSFIVSDFIMIYYNFGKKIPALRATNLLTYYLGQVLIAITIML